MEKVELLLEFGDGGSRRELLVNLEDALIEIEVEATQYFNTEVALCRPSGSATYILQRWSLKWSEFVDVNCPEEIESNDKLRVVAKSTVSVQ